MDEAEQIKSEKKEQGVKDMKKDLKTEKAPKTPMDKKKKKKIVRRCVFGGIAVVIVLFMALKTVVTVFFILTLPETNTCTCQAY